MHFLQKLQVTVVLLLIPFGGLYLYAQSQNISIREIFFPGNQVMHIGEIPLTVEVADTQLARETGLSGRDGLGNINGMLFIFDKPDYYGMWMKGMKFSIDIIWIDKDLKVVGITQDVTPNTYPRTFEPPVPVLYAVETNPHFADTFGINVGDMVSLPARYKSINL